MSKYRVVGFDVVEPDPELASDGVWMPVGTGVAEARVRPAGNTAFQRYYQARIKPYRRQIDAGNLDPEIQAKILAAAIARHILVDWRDLVQDEKGKDVPFSVDVAEEVLLADARVLADIAAASADQHAFQRAEDQEAAEALGKD